MKKQLRVIELFAGIGAPRKALIRGGYNYEIVDAIEIDKYAVKSYNAIYDANIEPKDVCEYKPNKTDVGEIDLLFHGSPCQDFSLAGKQAGGDKDSGTRSSLMYETIRIVEKLKPKYVIWENVKNLLSKKHRHNFDAYLKTMEQLGYTNYYQVLNAKDYGIPQNRERVFTISIRKDINKVFTFPPKQELKLKLKDMLEDEVDEKYYVKKTLNIKETQNYIQWSNSGKMQNSQAERAYYLDNDCMCTISHCNSNGDKTQIVLEDKTICLNSKDGRNGVEGTTNLQEECLKIGLFDDTSSNNFAKGKRDYGYRNEYGTLKCRPKYSIYKNTDLRIRKLTPKECWRLMGFDDEDFEKAAKVNSNTQLYKQAGNSIVVNVLMAIFDNLLQEYK